ncbi:MAG TPA: WecB/TagA/CpsF family glycosyltransferase [Candidatus Sulfotelmatobacter sp.]|jgi:exopolysaccharide biosynthesis WecB/TagA/CpsF family protein|nr:WecB/TagA/CpsF family glycosyltransferase [Candidatus Sulfotelmatobacter sp.]
MRNAGKLNVLGILIDAMDYEAAIDVVFRAAREKRATTISALAVHGLMTGALEREQKFRLNHFDLLVADGQPVRWALNLLHEARLPDRVYGPTLTLKICSRAAAEGIPVYFYGSTAEILGALRQTLEETFPKLIIAGMESSKFRRLTTQEKIEVASRIKGSGASIVFVGLGCPRQEMFAFEFRDILTMPILAVGAAFPFLAGKVPQAPSWMQAAGLEWVFRLAAEPRRLWRRYIYLNPAYVFLLSLQALGLCHFSTDGQCPAKESLYG